MRKWLNIIIGISLLFALCSCVAVVGPVRRPYGYYHRGYYYEYPRYRYRYNYYPYGYDNYYRYRGR